MSHDWNKGKRGTWKPGESGNPNGRPKASYVLKNKCQRVVDQYVVEAWEEEVKNKGPYWVRCSELLTAYAYGKPIAEEAEREPPTVTVTLTTEKAEELAKAPLTAELPSGQPSA
jgi:hypothetical protein